MFCFWWLLCLFFLLQCIQYIPITFCFYLWHTWFLLSVQFWSWNCVDIKDFHPSSIRWWSGKIGVWDGNNYCTPEENTALNKLCRSWCSLSVSREYFLLFLLPFQCSERRKALTLAGRGLSYPQKLRRIWTGWHRTFRSLSPSVSVANQPFLPLEKQEGETSKKLQHLSSFGFLGKIFPIKFKLILVECITCWKMTLL